MSLSMTFRIFAMKEIILEARPPEYLNLGLAIMPWLALEEARESLLCEAVRVVSLRFWGEISRRSSGRCGTRVTLAEDNEALVRSA
jgi:hypothetical protein